MLVSAKEMLEKAKAGHYAVGQFNINNLEWTKAVLLTAQELNSPVMFIIPSASANRPERSVRLPWRKIFPVRRDERSQWHLPTVKCRRT